MGVVAIVLIACAVVLVVGAEWPRLGGRIERRRPTRKKRARRKRDLTLVEGEGGDSDDFAKSVERDLANLPVLGDRDGRDDRTRR